MAASAGAATGGQSRPRAFYAGVTLMDNPAATDYKGALLVGSYAIDQEGVSRRKGHAGG